MRGGDPGVHDHSCGYVEGTFFLSSINNFTPVLWVSFAFRVTTHIYLRKGLINGGGL